MSRHLALGRATWLYLEKKVQCNKNYKWMCIIVNSMEGELKGRAIKSVLVGDGGTGKTTLMTTFTAPGTFPKIHPEVFDSYTAKMTINGQLTSLIVWTTHGQSKNEVLRPLNYQSTDIFFICFSVTDPISFRNVRKKWYPEIFHFSPTTPIILVGTKTDLRNDRATLRRLKNTSGTGPITHARGLQLMKDIGARRYVECSAVTCEGVFELFEEAVRLVPDLAAAYKLGRTKPVCTML